MAHNTYYVNSPPPPQLSPFPRSRSLSSSSASGRVQPEKQFPLDHAIQITKQVAGALSYAHGHVVLHRDAKPENILLSAGEPVKGE